MSIISFNDYHNQIEPIGWLLKALIFFPSEIGGRCPSKHPKVPCLFKHKPVCFTILQTRNWVPGSFVRRAGWLSQDPESKSSAPGVQTCQWMFIAHMSTADTLCVLCKPIDSGSDLPESPLLDLQDTLPSSSLEKAHLVTLRMHLSQYHWWSYSSFHLLFRVSSVVINHLPKF